MALSKVARGALGVVLLILSNSFMNAAQYLHLKFVNWSFVQAIFVSWAIALPEYSLQVPANRIAHDAAGGPFSAPQLKVIAEVCSLATFAVFSVVVLKEKLRWVDLGAFALILAGVLLSLLTKKTAHGLPTTAPPPPFVRAPAPPAADTSLASLPANASGGHRGMLELPKLGSGSGGVAIVANGSAEPAPASGDGAIVAAVSSSSNPAEPVPEVAGSALHGSTAGAQGEPRHRGRETPQPTAGLEPENNSIPD